MSSSVQPWMKFYPRDWRGDQALRLVSLTARGLWIEMLCLMHEATPYGHLLIGGQPLSDAALARIVGSGAEEVQALLVELSDAGVFRRTRAGVIYSKRMTDDQKRSIEGRKAKLEALEKAKENPRPSRGAPRPPSSPPPTQKPDTRTEVEGAYSPSTLCDANDASEPMARLVRVPEDIWEMVTRERGEQCAKSCLAKASWQDVPVKAIVCATSYAETTLREHFGKALKAAGITITRKDKAA